MPPPEKHETPAPDKPDPETPQPISTEPIAFPPQPGKQTSFLVRLLALRNIANIGRLNAETTNENVVTIILDELGKKEELIAGLKQDVERLMKMYKELETKQANKDPANKTEATPEPKKDPPK